MYFKCGILKGLHVVSNIARKQTILARMRLNVAIMKTTFVLRHIAIAVLHT